jgi:hypothetical protein
MAISHIPRSVGHNYLPEYQISAVPYTLSISRTSQLSFVVVQKLRTINGQANQNSYREVGFSAGEAVNSAVTLTISDVDTTPLLVFGDAGGEVPNDAQVQHLQANFVLVRKLSFPKITSWIRFENNANNPRKVYFCKFDVINAATAVNELTLTNNEVTLPLSLRVTDLYFKKGDDNNDGDDIKAEAGLTSIDRSEFKDTVETFLGDNK